MVLQGEYTNNSSVESVALQVLGFFFLIITRNATFSGSCGILSLTRPVVG